MSLFGSDQVMYVVRKADQAANVYELMYHDGSTALFRADGMKVQPQGYIELTVDGQLSGIISNQIRYLKMVEADN